MALIPVSNTRFRSARYSIAASTRGVAPGSEFVFAAVKTASSCAKEVSKLATAFCHVARNSTAMATSPSTSSTLSSQSSSSSSGFPNPSHALATAQIRRLRSVASTSSVMTPAVSSAARITSGRHLLGIGFFTFPFSNSPEDTPGSLSFRLPRRLNPYRSISSAFCASGSYEMTISESSFCNPFAVSKTTRGPPTPLFNPFSKTMRAAFRTSSSCVPRTDLTDVQRDTSSELAMSKNGVRMAANCGGEVG
mmetsp:Transcript_1537/g.5779  ORF Transcript_1537/g.5779 Transcript_1537/m.5779 type:complete len:250 (-) Transcript_1537:60-809(-)